MMDITTHLVTAFYAMSFYALFLDADLENIVGNNLQRILLWAISPIVAIVGCVQILVDWLRK